MNVLVEIQQVKFPMHNDAFSIIFPQGITDFLVQLSTQGIQTTNGSVRLAEYSAEISVWRCYLNRE